MGEINQNLPMLSHCAFSHSWYGFELLKYKIFGKSMLKRYLFGSVKLGTYGFKILTCIEY